MKLFRRKNQDIDNELKELSAYITKELIKYHALSLEQSNNYGHLCNITMIRDGMEDTIYSILKRRL